MRFVSVGWQPVSCRQRIGSKLSWNPNLPFPVMFPSRPPSLPLDSADQLPYKSCGATQCEQDHLCKPLQSGSDSLNLGIASPFLATFPLLLQSEGSSTVTTCSCLPLSRAHTLGQYWSREGIHAHGSWALRWWAFLSIVAFFVSSCPWWLFFHFALKGFTSTTNTS